MTRVGLVCEAESDQRTACTLASRILGHRLETCAIDPVIDRRPSFSKWSELRLHEPARSWPRKHVHGFGSSHGTGEARKALWLFQDKVDAVILMRDGDDQAQERVAALERARGESSMSCVILAVPRPEREAWHIAGFIPADDQEEARLMTLKHQLPFDPCSDSHCLSSGRDAVKRNAKRVLAVLTSNDASRAHACIAETDIRILRQRGHRNGLTAFFEEVAQLLGPVVTGD